MNEPDVRERTAPRSRRRRALIAVTASLLLVAGACVVPPDPVAAPDPYDVHTSIDQGTITVSWDSPEGYTGDDFEVQWYTSSTGWTPLPTVSGHTVTIEAPAGEGTYNVRVRAISDDPGAWSPPARFLYVEMELPVVRIDTADRAPIADKENYVASTVTIDSNGSGYVDYSGTAGIRGRGNSTWNHLKKPYRFKLDKKSPIMGLASERDWVLLANAFDESQLRNYIATEASRLTSLPYTPTMRHVEVVLNGQYIGVYTLTQHNEIGDDRVDITEMDEDDVAGEALTGGYRFEIDSRMEQNGEPGFRTGRGVPIVIKDPDPATPEQLEYARSQFAAFESALWDADFADPESGYRSLLHMDSWIDHYLVQEFTRNEDAFVNSAFITKERGDSKLRFGPVWDFDHSLGNNRAFLPDTNPWAPFAENAGTWNVRMFRDPTLRTEIGARWAELRDEFGGLAGLALSKGAELSGAIENDLLAWDLPGVRPNDEPVFIADWITQRVAWMDTHYPAP